MPNSGTRIMLVDCAGPPVLPAGYVERIRAETGSGFEFFSTSTAWNGGRAPLDLKGTEIVIINAAYSDLISGTLHATDCEELQSLLAAGGLVIVFVSEQARSFHLRNLVGIDQSIQGNPSKANA